MPKYGDIYAKFHTVTQRGVRQAAFIDDLGQNSWLRSTAELRDFLSACEIDKNSRVLDLGCGTGGVALALVDMFGCQVTGLDIDPSGITFAQKATLDLQLAARAKFVCADLNLSMPLEGEIFDVILSVDTLIHVLHRSTVFSEAFRVLKPGGALIFSDAGVLTGPMTEDEKHARATMAPICYSPPGEIEKQLKHAGFSVRTVRDMTAPLLQVVKARLEYIQSREDQAARDMGTPWIVDQIRYLSALKVITEEGRLSRFLYSSVKPGPAP